MALIKLILCFRIFFLMFLHKIASVTIVKKIFEKCQNWKKVQTILFFIFNQYIYIHLQLLQQLIISFFIMFSFIKPLLHTVLII